MTTVPVVCIALMGVLLFLLGATVTRHRAIRGATGNQAPSDPADRAFDVQDLEHQLEPRAAQVGDLLQ